MHDFMPGVWQAADPELFPDDAFVTAFRSMPGYFRTFASMLLPNEAVVHPLYVVLPFLVALVFSSGMYHLGRAAGLRVGYAALLTLCLCGRSETLTGVNFLTSGSFLPGATAAAFLLHALAFCLAGRWTAGFALIGAAANLHLLNALYVGTLATAASLCILMHERKRNDSPPRHRRRFPTAPGVAVLLALPTLLPLIRMGGGEIPADWAGFIQDSHIIHYALFEQYRPAILRLLCFLVLAVYLLRKALPFEASFRFFLAGYAAAYGFVFLIAGSIGTDVLGLPALIKLQPLRASAWLVPPVAAGLMRLLQRFADAPATDRVARTRWHILAGLLALIFASYCWRPHYSIVGFFFLPFFACLTLALWFRDETLSRPAVGVPIRALATAPMVYLVVFALALALELTTGLLIWMLDWNRFVLVVAATTGVWVLRIRETDMRRAMAWLAVAYFLSVMAAALVPLYRGQPVFHTPDPALLDAANWIREQTPKHAVLQGDPTRGGLRTWTRRPVYFEKDDDGALYIHPAGLDDYRRRARRVGVELEEKYSGRAWSPARMDFPALSAAHAFDYLLLPASRPAPFERVYTNGEYDVYATGFRALD